MLDLVPTELCSLPTGELTSYIVWRHHRFLRETLPPLQRMTAKLARMHGRRGLQLRALARTLDTFAGAVMSHILIEERILFPALASGSDRRLIREELFDADDEHALVEELLDELRVRATGESVATTSRLLAERFALLDADMRRHLALERDVLLPRFKAS
jgi:regulator of cell morphogenesis and NO signaling